MARFQTLMRYWMKSWHTTSATRPPLSHQTSRRSLPHQNCRAVRQKRRTKALFLVASAFPWLFSEFSSLIWSVRPPFDPVCRSITRKSRKSCNSTSAASERSGLRAVRRCGDRLIAGSKGSDNRSGQRVARGRAEVDEGRGGYPIRAARRGRHCDAQPPPCAQRCDARHGAGRSPPSSSSGRRTRRSRACSSPRRERAFSAGGDIRALYDLGKGGRHADALRFWREEYTLNALIKRYPEAVCRADRRHRHGRRRGLSIHGSHRVAGDRFQFAMPEVGYRILPGCGRYLVSAAHAGRDRHLLRAHRRSTARR